MWQWTHTLALRLTPPPPHLLPQEAGASGVSSGREDNEESFIDAGFHALGTNVVEGEDEDEEFSDRQLRVAIHSNDLGDAGASAVRLVETIGVNTATSPSQRKPTKTGGETGEDGKEQDELDVEEDEDFGDVELLVTHDGGIIPVPIAVVAESGIAAGASTVGTRGRHWNKREGEDGQRPASRAAKGKAAAGTAGNAANAAREKAASTAELVQRTRTVRGREGTADGGVAGVEEVKGERAGGAWCRGYERTTFCLPL